MFDASNDNNVQTDRKIVILENAMTLLKMLLCQAKDAPTASSTIERVRKGTELLDRLRKLHRLRKEAS